MVNVRFGFRVPMVTLREVVTGARPLFHLRKIFVTLLIRLGEKNQKSKFFFYQNSYSNFFQKDKNK